MRINDEVKKYLEEARFAALAVGQDLGRGEEPVLLVKSTGDVLKALKEKNAPVRAAFAVDSTEKGPVACMLVTSTAEGAAGFAGEIYFDPLDDADYALLLSMGEAPRLVAALFDEQMNLVRAPEIEWDDIMRLLAAQAADRGDELAERALLYGIETDFEVAVGLFREKWPLEKLENLVREVRGGK